MDQKELHALEALCIQEEPPGCQAGCPLGVNARAFVQAVGKDDLAGGRAILEKSMPLAGIVARMCEAPCEQYCKRETLGGAIAIGRLERMCIEAVPSKAKFLKLPPKSKKVAVIGAGPSSLALANDLAKKGHPIHVYHTESGPGGWLRNLTDTVLKLEVIDQELKRLESFGVKFHPVKVLDYALCTEEYDAVYIGQDDELAADLLAMIGPADGETCALDQKGWFTGGLQAEGDPYRFIMAVSQGREAAISIDRFLQGASLTASRVKPRNGKTDLFVQTKDLSELKRIEPADQAGYTREEAVEEALRCIDCQCLECVRNCVYLAEYKSYPKVYARRIYNNSAIVKGVHQANTFINSCSLCRQCEVICPNDFSMADLCLQARQQMVVEERMPPSAHWFGLEEMKSAQGESRLLSHAQDQQDSAALFYPGCQLAGIRHLQTVKLYNELCAIEPKTGIWLDCCGAPAYWSGRQEDFEIMVEGFRNDWQSMGKPRLILACSTCLKLFRDNLPEIESVSVWKLLAEQQLVKKNIGKNALALSDPCTSRDDVETQGAVRSILQQLEQPLAPLEMSGKLTECCGYGGLMAGTDPALGRKVVEARVKQTESVMLTYCAMCRDRLALTGKPVLHLLDLLYPETALEAATPAESISARRVNRRRLKQIMAERCGKDELPQRYDWENIELVISQALEIVMEERHILEDDVRRVLHDYKQSGRHIAHGSENRKLASSRIGAATFWVEFYEEGDTFHLLRCWSHRMSIHQPDTGGR